MSKSPFRPFCLLLALTLLLHNIAFAAAPTVKLASDGKPAWPVVVPGRTSQRILTAAQTLADVLTRITGAKFQVTAGDGAAGIALGLSGDFPAAPQTPALDTKSPTAREDYILRSHERGLLLMGASDLAVEHAVWDLLYRLGYRQFFPGAHWEVVPHERDISIAVEAIEHPAYYTRRIWYGFGPWDYAEEPYRDWCARNRATSGIELSTGHAYDGFLRGNKAAFAEHPEYLGLVNGKRTSSKFCISNPGLRKLLVEHAMRHFDSSPESDSMSVDPSDGGGWCECDACAKMGSVTDRALTLANEIAAAVNAKYPGKIIGMYAYNYHSPPPNIQAHPQVVVSVATAFIKGGQTLDELIAGWSAKVSTLGIREYYSVNTWDRDLPGNARGGNIDYLKRTIPEFHAKGAHFLSAESSDNWGPNGLGYYLAARMLWDVREAGRIDALVEDFLSRAFGPAKESMREFYRQLDGSKPHLVAADQIGRMFRALDQARRLADTPEISARLDDLLLYCHYVDLYHRYAKATGPARQLAFEALIRHAYRMRETMMIHVKALYRDLAGRDKSVQIPAEARWNAAEGKNPWKSSAPFTAEELSPFLAQGIAAYPLTNIDFKPVAFSDDLVPAAALKLPDTAAPGQFGAARGKQIFYTFATTVPASIDVQITGGLIAGYRDRGNVRVSLVKIGGASQTGERETLVAQDRSAAPDGNPHPVKLPIKEPGLYKVIVEDGGDRTLVKWDCPLPLSIKSTIDEPMNAAYSELWQLYFYVPKDTKTVAVFGGHSGEIRDADNRPLLWLNGREPNYYCVDVPQNQDGKIWQIRYGQGSIRLLTVPPYLARTAAELLIPVEVIKKDAPQGG